MKVYIENSSYAYQNLFQNMGFEIVSSLTNFPDLVCFTGGEDVDPIFYHHKRHPSTYSNWFRDQNEESIFLQALDCEIPMVGICRGAQFLNVMNGGTVYQDVGGHLGDHIIDTDDGEILVSSTHHQMMLPAHDQPDVEVLATASQGCYKTIYDTSVKEFKTINDPTDYEVVLYPETKSLCFQPHPEFTAPRYEGMRRYFEKLVYNLVS